MASTDFITVIIAGTSYKIPKNAANPQWGEELTDYLQAVADALSTIVGEGDIPETSATINNNQVAPLAISTFTFDPALVRAARIAYTINRSTASTYTSEAGVIQIIYDANNSIGQKWTLQRDAMGIDSGVNFTISDAGLVSYTSSSLPGASYTGILKFEALAITSI